MQGQAARVVKRWTGKARSRQRPRAHRKGRTPELRKNGQTPPETRAQHEGRSPEQRKDGQIPSETRASHKDNSPEQPARMSASRDSRPLRGETRIARQSRKRTQPQTRTYAQQVTLRSLGLAQPALVAPPVTPRKPSHTPQFAGRTPEQSRSQRTRLA